MGGYRGLGGLLPLYTKCVMAILEKGGVVLDIYISEYFWCRRCGLVPQVLMISRNLAGNRCEEVVLLKRAFAKILGIIDHQYNILLPLI